MSLEGRVRVSASHTAGRLQRVSVSSDRPLVADRLLAGRTPAEAVELLPRVLAVCGRSQAVVAASALDAAARHDPGAAILRRRERELAAETATEHAFRLLLDWPVLAGTQADPELLSRIRSLLSQGPESEAAWGAARDAVIGMVEARILGADLDSWLEQFSAGEWLDWAAGGGTGTARTLAALAALPPWAGPETRLLDGSGHGDFLRIVAGRALAEPGFAARPELDGEPAECGPYARGSLHPAVRDLARHDRITARAFARLVELAGVLREETCAGRLESTQLGPATGGAAGEMARGVLVHAVTLEAGRISRYAVVAPTEWNFHPSGPLARELEGRPVPDPAAARRALEIAAATLDPCVELDVELSDA